MMEINQTETIKKQYSDADKLNIRISIHQKYSTNKLGFGNWIYSNYDFIPNINILELGCGTGEMWKILADEYNADKEVCIIAAWLHDIASITDYKLYKEHHIHGTIIADEIFLNKIQVEKMIYMED